MFQNHVPHKVVPRCFEYPPAPSTVITVLLTVSPALYFTSQSLRALLCFKVPPELEDQMGMEWVKTPPDLLFLMRCSHFSWLNSSWISVNLWFISKVLKKFILTMSVSFLIAFCKRGIFQEILTLPVLMTISPKYYCKWNDGIISKPGALLWDRMWA